MLQFDRLVDIMARLRGPGGCPWDHRQTHQSLKPYLVEETHEALDAIDAGEDAELKEELGDVLLQVVFHAQIAREQGRFDIEDVAAAISEKLLRRHPHVFGAARVKDADQVLENWEKIKSDEQQQKGRDPSLLEGIPRHLPGLLRAAKIQEKAARVGFEWEQIEDVKQKAREEVEEFLAAVSENDPAKTEEELGDLLFALVNLSRFLKTDPEEALRKTIRKFTDRFQYIESRIKKSGKTLENTTLPEMDRLWEEAKNRRHLDQP